MRTFFFVSTKKNEARIGREKTREKKESNNLSDFDYFAHIGRNGLRIFGVMYSMLERKRKGKGQKNSNNNGYKFTDSIHSPFIRESTFSSINTNTSGRQQKKLIRKKTWSEWRNWIMEERKTERKQPNEEEDVGSIETTTPCIHL